MTTSDRKKLSWKGQDLEQMWRDFRVEDRGCSPSYNLEDEANGTDKQVGNPVGRRQCKISFSCFDFHSKIEKKILFE